MRIIGAKYGNGPNRVLRQLPWLKQINQWGWIIEPVHLVEVIEFEETERGLTRTMAIMLMPQDVAVIHEIADIPSAEIHSDNNAWIRTGPRPIGNLNHVEELLLLRRHRHAVQRQQQEMNLMDMEFMNFPSPILNSRLRPRPA